TATGDMAETCRAPDRFEAADAYVTIPEKTWTTNSDLSTRHDGRGGMKWKNRLSSESAFEQGRADPHQGCPLFDRNFEVVRHAHGETIQSDGGSQPLLELVADRANRGNRRPRPLGL